MITVIPVQIGELGFSRREGFCVYPVNFEKRSRVPVAGPTIFGRLASAVGLLHPHHTWTWGEIDGFPPCVDPSRHRHLTLPDNYGIYRVLPGAMLFELRTFMDHEPWDLPVTEAPPLWWDRVQEFDGEVFVVERNNIRDPE